MEEVETIHSLKFQNKILRKGISSLPGKTVYSFLRIEKVLVDWPKKNVNLLFMEIYIIESSLFRFSVFKESVSSTLFHLIYFRIILS